MILALSVHPSRLPDLLAPERLHFEPHIPATEYRDVFNNICHVISPPPVVSRFRPTWWCATAGSRTKSRPGAAQIPLEKLPVETLVFLLGSRYCETDRLTEMAWSTFGKLPKGWGLVQAICDFVHDRITFGYQYASSTKTAWEAYNDDAACAATMLISRSRSAAA